MLFILHFTRNTDFTFSWWNVFVNLKADDIYICTFIIALSKLFALIMTLEKFITSHSIAVCICMYVWTYILYRKYIFALITFHSTLVCVCITHIHKHTSVLWNAAVVLTLQLKHYSFRLICNGSCPVLQDVVYCVAGDLTTCALH